MKLRYDVRHWNKWTSIGKFEINFHQLLTAINLFWLLLTCFAIETTRSFEGSQKQVWTVTHEKYICWDKTMANARKWVTGPSEFPQYEPYSLREREPRNGPLWIVHMWIVQCKVMDWRTDACELFNCEFTVEKRPPW